MISISTAICLVSCITLREEILRARELRGYGLIIKRLEHSKHYSSTKVQLQEN